MDSCSDKTEKSPKQPKKWQETEIKGLTERLDSVVKEYYGNYATFAEKIGITRSIASRMKKSPALIMKYLIHIAKACEGLDVNWFLFGGKRRYFIKDELIKYQEDVIKYQKDQIQVLNDKIKLMEKLLKVYETKKA